MMVTTSAVRRTLCKYLLQPVDYLADGARHGVSGKPRIAGVYICEVEEQRGTIDPRPTKSGSGWGDNRRDRYKPATWQIRGIIWTLAALKC